MYEGIPRSEMVLILKGPCQRRRPSQSDLKLPELNIHTKEESSLTTFYLLPDHSKRAPIEMDLTQSEDTRTQ